MNETSSIIVEQELCDLMERYKKLEADFIAYVCDGVNKPAPYCANASLSCVDGRGWCINGMCSGFYPKASSLKETE